LFGVIPASFSTELIPAASIFLDGLRATPASDVNGVVGAVSASSLFDFLALFFSLLMSNCPSR